MRLILRSLIFAHRWIGVVLCLVFLLWFPSGIGMMYWTFPDVSAGDRLDHSPKLDPTKIVLSPTEAADKAGVQANPTQIRLNSFDGRPTYRIGGGGRGGGGGRIIYADTGEEQTEVSPEMLDRIASQWARQPIAEAKRESIEEPDQWTVAGQLRNLRPMYKYSWPDGQQVYMNGTTGEVVQYTTFAKRVAAHISAIPHWVYYTPLRKNQPVWINFMVYGSLIGTISAILGMIVAVWMYSPKRRYRLDGKPTGIPYRGQKRWHGILGMVFGIATVTWTFSGLMSLGPFPLMQRLTGQTPRNERIPPPPQQQQQEAGQEQAQQASAEARGTAAVSREDRQRGGAVAAVVRGGPSGEGGQAADSARGDGQRRSFGPGGPRRGGRGGEGRRGNRGGETPATENRTEGSQANSAPTGDSASDSGERRRPRRQTEAAPGAEVSGGNRAGEARGGAPIAANAGGDRQAGQPQSSNNGAGGRGGGQQGIAEALRGRVRMVDFADVHPRDLLAKAPNLDVRELEWTSFAGTPIFSASFADGKSQFLSLDGTLIDGFDQQKVIEIVKGAIPNMDGVEIKRINQYDLYYLDRTRQRPLPVILVLMNDEERTRYYIDPKSARVVTTYSNRNWVNRWLYTGLHSLNFPFLYNHRPLWDIVVIAFMVGGTGLCVTSLVLAWRTLGRKLKRTAVNDVLPGATAS